VAITSTDMTLTKAHVRYLESRLISLLKDARKSVVMNRTDPGFERLPEADVADMETFLDQIRLVLPVIGVDQLRRPHPRTVIPETSTTTLSADGQGTDDQASLPSTGRPSFVLTHAARGIRAVAVETEGEFVILAGATGDLNTAPSLRETLRVLREQALESGRAVTAPGGRFRLVQDLAVGSPSAAAASLFGTSRNGRTDRLVQGTGQTCADDKTALLDGVVPI